MSTATAPRTSQASAPEPTSRRRRGGGRRGLLYALLVILTLIFVSPLLYMLSTSFKTTADAAAPNPQWIPQEPTLQAYDSILTTSGTPVVRWLINSLLAASFQTLLILITASMAAYALARIDFRGKKIVFGVIIGTLFVPPVILLIPNYLVVGRLGWLDTLLAVILPGAAGAFGVFFLRQFFLSLPIELEEAARIDGATRWRTFRQIILPLSRPALVTLALLSFLTNWNDFLWPVYVLFSPENQTLPAGLSTLQNANAVRYDLLMAGAVIASVPVLAMYFFAQRYIVEGVGRAGLKG
ncbi:carbohydrate ABC transporter permease [Georgenia yuyongxinii]|uniref:Carbohydrate ABC transporter permease n=1 Tax=Georgenia yuyongxinii TaxID=2589797 RepID=A0A5B8C4N1_9MICO|nr:carbohydrate ABC transporter permease [Georgenia yuyongxinii]QDC25533.1 carbohydrate ABC transporter permease [Georgenia yuyongxinii]